MRLRDLFPLSWRALTINKSRSALTMLGIIIGITSVILMISIGQAAQNYLLSQVSSFGSDLIAISNGKGDETRGGPPSATQKQTLTEHDYEKLKTLPWIKAISVTVMTNDLVSYGGQDSVTAISGSAPGELAVYNMQVATGRFFDETDVQGQAHVIVLGKDIAKKLFGEENPIGRTVKVSKVSYRVIGILGPVGTRFFSNIDEQVYVPYTTFMTQYNKNRVNFIMVKAGDVKPTQAKELVRIALRETHNINNPDGVLSKDDFRVGSQDDAAKSIATIGTILQILLGSVASLSLFVAGIGIMNIMYVTVTERTREIGLRKAIGATRGDILGQFLAEAIMLTVVAGAIGIALGISFSWIGIQIIKHFDSHWTFMVAWNGVIISFTVSAAIGIIFGYFPARQAAKLSPIEALRYE